MPIQFFCTSCRKPIEVDDEAANQPVTCPYCQTAVTAPPTSDPTVRQSAPRAGSPAEIAPPEFIAEPPKAPSILAWSSLICAFLLIVCLGITMIVAYKTASQLPAGTSQKDMTNAVADSMKSPMMMTLSLAGTCGLPFIGVVCAIAALIRKANPRWPAILSLVVLTGYVLFVCAGVAMKISQVSGAKGS